MRSLSSATTIQRIGFQTQMSHITSLHSRNVSSYRTLNALMNINIQNMIHKVSIVQISAFFIFSLVCDIKLFNIISMSASICESLFILLNREILFFNFLVQIIVFFLQFIHCVGLLFDFFFQIFCVSSIL